MNHKEIEQLSDKELWERVDKILNIHSAHARDIKYCHCHFAPAFYYNYKKAGEFAHNLLFWGAEYSTACVSNAVICDAIFSSPRRLAEAFLMTMEPE